MNTGVLIPDPVLDDRSEQQRIRDALLRTQGQVTVEDAQFAQSVWREIELFLASGQQPPPILLPEITSVRPGEPQTVFIEELTRLSTEMLKRINQIPNKVNIRLLQLLNTFLIPASPATTTLSFTKLDAYLNQDLLIPAGTPIVTLDGANLVNTDQDLTIPTGTAASTITATSAVAGNIKRVLSGAAWRPQIPIAGIFSVTNTADLSGGRDAETVAQAALRARESMRIGQHLGSSDDYVTYITLWILHGVGRVTVFEQFRGDFSPAGPGYAMIAVQSDGGLAPDSGTLNQVSQVISDRHVSGITVVAGPPLYKKFSIQANVVVTPQTPVSPSVLIAQAVTNLQNWFNPLTFPYGPNEPQRWIALGDIVGAITSSGPHQIAVDDSFGVFAITILMDNGDGTTTSYNQDVALQLGELPLLTGVTLTPVSPGPPALNIPQLQVV